MEPTKITLLRLTAYDMYLLWFTPTDHYVEKLSSSSASYRRALECNQISPLFLDLQMFHMARPVNKTGYLKLFHSFNNYDYTLPLFAVLFLQTTTTYVLA